MGSNSDWCLVEVLWVLTHVKDLRHLWMDGCVARDYARHEIQENVADSLGLHAISRGVEGITWGRNREIKFMDSLVLKLN